MATFRYRAATPTGGLRTGALEGVSQADALLKLRRLGLAPIEAVETERAPPAGGRIRIGGASRQAVANAIGELAVLLQAGLPLDRALAIGVENVAEGAVKAAFARLQARVKEGVHLSEAMAESPAVFPPIASAMAAAGEADGRLGPALARLAETLERAEALRQSIVSSLVYPAILIVVATGVILVMMLVVVPQFEGLLSGEGARLPFMTRLIMAASEAVRADGVYGALALLLAAIGTWRWLKRPKVRLAFDRWILSAPVLGPLVANAETAAFARTLGNLIDGGVPLPTALAIAQRTIGNTHMSGAVARVAAGLKQGGGLSGPLAASGVFPPIAVSFLRTGEETAQLGLMLGRLADVLDRNVRTTIARLIAVLTPAITVLMGGIVATTIASIMSAILGFNDLALAP